MLRGVFPDFLMFVIEHKKFASSQSVKRKEWKNLKKINTHLIKEKIECSMKFDHQVVTEICDRYPKPGNCIYFYK